jgi:poly(A) polymerase
MYAAGVLDRALPRADAARLDALLAAEGPAPPDWLRRLAALGAGGEAEALRLSRAEARALAALREAAGGGEGAFALGHRLGAARGRDALLLRGPLPPGAEAALEAGARAEFPLTAGDLMPALTGPALGDALARARAAWAAAEGRPDAAALRRVALASIPGAGRAAQD